MGKYIRKSKTTKEDEPLMDIVSSSPSLGVLTRARSLALQQQQQQHRLRKPSSYPSPSKQMNDFSSTGGSYLQLRSRRLQKIPPIGVIRSSNRRKQQRRNPNPNVNRRNNRRNLDSVSGDGSRSDSVSENVGFGKDEELICEDPSSGDNFLDLKEATQSFNRTTRESTPCITSPGSSSSAKLNICISEVNQREENLSDSHCHLPTTPEMDEFFSGAEEQQQKQFIEKYNFDPVMEKPLPGRFEWTKVDDYKHQKVGC